MRHPTLRQVEADLGHIKAMAPKLLEAARWAWPLAYSRLARAEVGRGGGDVARPVEAAVSTEGAPEWVVRTEVGRAGILIAQATQQLELASGCLARAYAAADVDPVPELVDAGARPLVSRAELNRARAAQIRRAGRGEGYGHS